LEPQRENTSNAVNAFLKLQKTTVGLEVEQWNPVRCQFLKKPHMELSWDPARPLTLPGIYPKELKAGTEAKTFIPKLVWKQANQAPLDKQTEPVGSIHSMQLNLQRDEIPVHATT
jgi:hypothetical protein